MKFQLGKAFSRRAATKQNALFYYWKYFVNARRTRYASRHSPVHPKVESVAQEIAIEGIVIGNVADFLSEEGLRNFAQAKAMVLKLSLSGDVQRVLTAEDPTDAPRYKSSKDYLISLISPKTMHQADGPVIKLALDPKVLEIVAAYLGLWPRLYQIHSWLNYPTDEPPKASQMWHRDPEDIRLVKVFFYLVDVDEDTGPFTYIPRTHSFGELAGRVPGHKDHKRIEDSEMNPILPTDLHRVCTGPADTMILADTVGYHRGGKPRTKNRILLTFTYTSAWSRGGPLMSGLPSWPMNDMQRMALQS